MLIRQQDWAGAQAALNREHQTALQAADIAAQAERQARAHAHAGRMQAADQAWRTAAQARDQAHQLAVQSAQHKQSAVMQVNQQLHEAGMQSNAIKSGIASAMLGHKMDVEKLKMQHAHEKGISRAQMKQSGEENFLDSAFDFVTGLFKD